jgi:uroporphyrinogen III methyltransferase/synthase
MTRGPQRTGKVFLVGAGPGDPRLLTLRGKDCLEQADVVLYDHLANPVLLDYAPPHAERIYVGRKGRGFYTDQEEINQTLISKAREGKCVVRLKGGDPFVFGRGGEEAEVIAAAGLPYEVVPGVTSAVAVPAYAGIPVTHRTLASTVAFVTGHEDPTKAESALEWPRLASSEGTLVFLMGMKNLPHIVERLLQEGKDPQTPVALIRWGTYPRQHTVIGTLFDIVERARAEAIDPPTVIVVGEVVTLRDRLNWFETRPLCGKWVVVTRPREQAPALSTLLTAYGAEPLECPTLEIVPPDSWEELDKAIKELPTYQWLVVTSVNGVRAFMGRLRSNQYDARRLAGLGVCCIGPGTAKEMEGYGVQADYIPAIFQAEGLIEMMKEKGVKGQRVLIPRAEVARDLLPDQLRALGAEVRVVTAYRAVSPKVQIKELKDRLLQRQIHYLTFASSSTVRNFCQLFESREELKKLIEGSTVACIGPITAQTVREQGLPVGLVASQNTIPALVESIVQYEERTKSDQSLYSHKSA